MLILSKIKRYSAGVLDFFTDWQQAGLLQLVTIWGCNETFNLQSCFMITLLEPRWLILES